MNQKTVRQLKKFARENNIEFRRLVQRWQETPWYMREAFRGEITGKVVSVKDARHAPSNRTLKQAG